jgi:hypothetical protein
MAIIGKKGDGFGEAEYRQGAKERLLEALDLLREERFGGSIYLAGRGVEGMLRAVIWKSDAEVRQGRKSLESGHDLRQLLTLVRKLGLFRFGDRDQDFEQTVHRVARLWFNNMRFASSRFVENRWRAQAEVHKRRTFKQAALGFHEACLVIVKRCEALWQH